MNKKYCKYCDEKITGSSHTCRKTGKTYHENSDGDFALSMIVGYATDSTVIGTLIGGDPVGAVLGDLLNDDSSSSDNDSSSDSSFDFGGGDSGADGDW